MEGMDAIRQTFFEECDEQLIEMETGLLAMEEGDCDNETVNAVFRAVHSIKGGAGAFQLQDLVNFAHTFETTLDLIREGKLEASADVMKVMLRASDILSDLVVAARDELPVDEETWKPVAKELSVFNGDDGSALDGSAEEEEEDFDFQPVTFSFDDVEAPELPEEEEVVEPENEFSINFKPKPELYANANDPCLLFRELARLGQCTVACDFSAVPKLDELEPEGAYFAWSLTLKTTEDESEVCDIFEFVEGDCDLTIDNESSDMPSAMDIAALIDQAKADVDSVKSDDVDDLSAGGVDGLPDATDLAMPEVPDVDVSALLEAASVEEPVAEPAAEPVAIAEPAQDPIPEPAAAAPEPKAAEAPAPAAKAAPAKPQKAAPQQSIRVDLDRVDRLINLVGELVINQAMLSQSVLRAGLENSADVTGGLDELEQLTREIQDSVMAIRAQPVKPLFQRMSRVVREAAEATGKKVRLKSEGETTEVDKTVIEKLSDPLTHMIRNAVDHGIEAPDKRSDKGKQEEGTIQLYAAHRSGRVVIEISDDGAGINRERVREIAVNKNLITADAQLSDNEIDNLIFAPGFSTASAVSDLSGRGVGMDVVKRSIQALGGRVSIASEPGKGSTFTMTLPLTLAVLDGMVVSVGDQTLVVPITAVVETLRPTTSDVHMLGSDAQVVSIRDQFIPIVDTGAELGFKDQATRADESVAILVEADDGSSSALLVDRIQDQSQVVIKSLETNYGQVDGIAAATILGDGRVALILDVDALVERSRNDSLTPDAPMALAG